MKMLQFLLIKEPLLQLGLTCSHYHGWEHHCWLVEKPWASPVYVLDLRLCREERKTKPQSCTSLLMHLPQWWCQDCWRSLLRPEGISACCGKDMEFFFLILYRNFARTEKLWGKLRGIPSHTWVLCSILFTSSLPTPAPSLSYIFLPSDGRMQITLQGVTSEDAWERTSLFQIIRRRGCTQVQDLGLRNQVQISPCISYTPPQAAPTRHLYYCCSRNSLPLTQTWLSKTQRHKLHD